ncbi:hypothetical protein [Austwickia chelonae]|uniref:hypothetical protein n=1 Tax=Austwickia chelonae TaxID=100225 RepID=UPI000E25AFBB|nr:hypothetical protein [Austwickia chelonae]
MAERSLVVRFDDVDAIISDLEKTQRNFLARIEELRQNAEHRMPGWSTKTESRRARDVFDARLAESVKEMGESLGRIRAALVDVRASAHRCEVRNVAIMD